MVKKIGTIFVIAIVVLVGYVLYLQLQSAFSPQIYSDSVEDNPTIGVRQPEMGFNISKKITATVVKKNELKSITLTAVGDINLARSIQDIYYKHDTPWYLEDVKDAIGGDVVFANLESVISDKGVDSGKEISFRAHPDMMNVLLDGGFDIVSVSNNHSYDWGESAFDDSIARLKAAGIITVGSYLGDVLEIVPYEVDGMKLGFIAISNKNRPLDEDALIELIKENNDKYDFIIASIHWGSEYKTKSGKKQQDLARKMVNAGVDVVLGHHPHVLQEVEEINGKLIFYSLGNFLFDQWWSKNTMKGEIVKINLHEDGTMQYQLIDTNNYDKKVKLGH